jgi:tetratricopeptide (TPR) repeat protein
MRLRALLLGVALTAAVASALPAGAVTDDERSGVYRQFRQLFDAHRYTEALPVAQQLVKLTEEQYGADDPNLVAPLVNLATTQYRLKDYPTAEQSYLRSVQILEAKSAPTDRALIRPLHGLGATYLAAGAHESASTTLKRAVDLSRNLDGLFNSEQLALLDPLIASYVALGQLAEAEKEHQYAFRVAESTFGKSDPRMLGPLDRYARWFEYVGRYTTARALHVRALAIAEKAGGRDSLGNVDPLRGVARSYRLEFLYGPEQAQGSGQEAFDYGSSLPEPGAGRLDADGERALRLALQILERNEPVDRSRRGQTLVELGDWYMSGGAINKALEAYRNAWPDLSATGGAEMLATPQPLVYRPPASSITRTRLTPEQYDEVPVTVRFTVERDGRTENVIAAPSTQASETMLRSVISAVRKARYRPRIADGEPVETADVVHTERMALRRPESRG